MQTSPPDSDPLARMLRAWQLASLRFAVTRDDTDKLVFFATAAELDKQGMAASCFNFFRRTSVQLCRVITDETGNLRTEVLQQHLARIPDERLRSAFAAAVGVGLAIEKKTKPRKKKSLWDGLVPQNAGQRRHETRMPPPERIAGKSASGAG